MAEPGTEEVAEAQPVSADAPYSHASMASVREQAAWAEAAVDILEKRVGQLESDLGALRQSQQDIARHLEEAVGPAGEGAHRQHWWSRRH